MKNWKSILALTLAVLILIVSFQNLRPVRLQMLFWALDISPVLLLPLMLLTGFAAGILMRKKRG